MKKFSLLNNVSGFVIFLFAMIVYWACMETTLSFWDCGEFISAAYRMEVGHQPGAPLFLMIGKLFSLLAGSNVSKVAYWVNFVSVVASAATVMFLFWTINAIALKLININDNQLSALNKITVISAGAIGALAYTFSDTFWFSAVEAEVYGISTLCTAIVFWGILKWEQTLNDRWLLFIAFLIGLSIGIHLLSLLAIPAISLVYYFRKTTKATLIGTIKAFFIGCILLGLVQFGVIRYFVMFAAKADLLAVNTFGMSFGMGALIFLAMVAGGLVYGLRYSIKKKKYQLNLALLATVFVLFGFSSYFMIIIRANAKPNINLSNPDTPMALLSYLGREQYGSQPVLYGQLFNSNVIESKAVGTTYRKGEKSYEESGQITKQIYDKNSFLPRMYSDKPAHIAFYKNWAGLAEGETPSLMQNLSFLGSYQMGFMYWRYFAWNFVGRQNDVQGQGEIHQGNWLSGIKPLDAARLGNQNNLPQSIANNPGYNLFYGLPLILGLLGMWFLYREKKSYALVIGTLFFCTGLAIIIYLNQDPLQVRERDYAYVGSFYAFAIAIGIGVLAIKYLLAKIATSRMSLILATCSCLAVPVLMGINGWDDHNRNGKTTALDMAKNYLNSCEPNAILFTNADNDTYPLWYAQEVEGIRTDVRVICLQFLSSDAYIDHLKEKQNLSAPLPVTMAHDQYKEGIRDFLPYVDYGLTDSVELSDLFSVLTSDNQADKVQMSDGSYANFLPTKKLKMTIDPNQLIATKTIAEKDKSQITAAMEWNINEKYLFKKDLAMFDILVHNNWKRPIYFSFGVSEDSYMGLDKYLYLEGFAYHLLPLKPKADPNANKENNTNNDLAYKHYQNFELKGFKKAKYLDSESRSILQNTWSFANTLTTNLIEANEPKLAQQTLDKSLRELPLENATITDTVSKISLVQNLHLLNNGEQATKITTATVNYVSQELDYILTLNRSQQLSLINNIRAGMYVLQSLGKINEGFGKKDLTILINRQVKTFEERFMKSLG
jgi:hypothetical protein